MNDAFQAQAGDIFDLIGDDLDVADDADGRCLGARGAQEDQGGEEGEAVGARHGVFPWKGVYVNV
jgi:hypothetical protein